MNWGLKLIEMAQDKTNNVLGILIDVFTKLLNSK